MFSFFRKIFILFRSNSISKREICTYIYLIDNFKLQKHFISKAYRFYLNNPNSSLSDIRQFLISHIGFKKYLFLKIKHVYFKKFNKELSSKDYFFIKEYINKLNFFDPVYFDADNFIDSNLL